MVVTAPTKVFQLLPALPFINHTHIDPDYATSSSHDLYFSQHILKSEIAYKTGIASQVNK